MKNDVTFTGFPTEKGDDVVLRSFVFSKVQTTSESGYSDTSVEQRLTFKKTTTLLLRFPLRSLRRRALFE
jgi:hypothetical protein